MLTKTKKQVQIPLEEWEKMKKNPVFSDALELLHRYSDNCFENIVFSEEAANLAKKYMIEGVVDKTSIEDCRHIALATINQCNVLASWNFKHIVNLEKINGYNSVNLKSGYHILEIRSPKELVRYGD